MVPHQLCGVRSGIRDPTHGLASIVRQVCLHLFIGHESTTFDVMKEAQSFDVLLKSARYVVGIAPETRSVEFVRDILHHKTNFSQLTSCLGGGTEGKCAIVGGRLVQDPMDEKDDLLGGGRYIAARLKFRKVNKNRLRCT